MMYNADVVDRNRVAAPDVVNRPYLCKRANLKLAGCGGGVVIGSHGVDCSERSGVRVRSNVVSRTRRSDGMVGTCDAEHAFHISSVDNALSTPRSGPRLKRFYDLPFARSR